MSRILREAGKKFLGVAVSGLNGEVTRRARQGTNRTRCSAGAQAGSRTAGGRRFYILYRVAFTGCSCSRRLYRDSPPQNSPSIPMLKRLFFVGAGFPRPTNGPFYGWAGRPRPYRAREGGFSFSGVGKNWSWAFSLRGTGETPVPPRKIGKKIFDWPPLGIIGAGGV